MTKLQGQLVMVATPIGNLEDMSRRAARMLGEADVVLAEDTRRTRALLAHLGIANKQLVRLDAHVEQQVASRWAERIALGERIAVVSDAGTPAISDPGAALVRAAARLGIAVVPIPGPSAVAAALAASGMPADRFRFFGFPPRKGAARRAMLAQIDASEETVVLFESPQRTSRTLAELAERMPEREAVVARELTKLHEELVRGPLARLAAPREWRGEITIVLGPYRPAVPPADIDQRIDELRGDGMHARLIAKTLAGELGVAARQIYARVVGKQRTG